MIPPETLLYIYEIRGDWQDNLPAPPSSFIGLWNEEEFAYLFFSRPEDRFVNGWAGQAGLEVGPRHEMKYEDWQTGLPSQGIRLGGTWFVSPGHSAPPQGAVVLDPSVVFGDGNHPTTIACLTFMEEIIGSGSIQSALDLGTGTGILALAAAAKGVGKIVAVDKNHLAVSTARENVETNAFSELVTVHEGEARCFIDEPFDLVTANLPFQVLRELVPLRGAALHTYWIVSGINREQANVIKELLEDQGYAVTGETFDPPWVTFVANHRSLTPPR